MPTNIVSTQSRFAILIEKSNDKNIFNKKVNNKTNEDKHNKKNNKPVTLNNKVENINKIHIANITNKEVNILADEIFPELSNISKVNNPKNIHLQDNINYMAKIKQDKVDSTKQITTNNEFNDDIEPGWVEISFNRKTREFTRRYNLRNNNKNNIISNENKVLNALIETHNRRTQEYINMWGYDEWEKIFRFPNYDYEYFDKLDEAYENEMEDIDNSDLEYDYFSE